LSNLRFARTVEPHNTTLQQYQAWCEQQRALGQPTLPSHLGQECAINPFLRVREPSVRHAVQQQDAAAIYDVSTFAALRRWKDGFR
jgi:hydroxyacylglutathione hydrolase